MATTTANAASVASALPVDELSAFNAAFEKLTPDVLEGMSDSQLAKAWIEVDEQIRLLGSIGRKLESSRDKLTDEADEREFVRHDPDTGVAGTVIRLTARKAARVIGKSRTGTGWKDAFNAFKSTLVKDSPEYNVLTTVQGNHTETKVTTKFEVIDLPR
jgi:hypothetical protein